MKTATLEGREAIPVGRFSTDKQDEGDSRTRQSLTFAAVCRRMQLEPSPRFAIFDSGKSAYHSRHIKPDAEFGKFLEMVRTKKISPDNHGRMPVLVWEAVDRFSRMPGFEATEITRLLVQSGFALFFEDDDIWIDASTIDDEWSEFQSAIHAGRKFSKKLSGRIKKSWIRKNESTRPTRHKCPSWLQWDATTQSYLEVPERVSQVKQAVQWAIDGKGQREIRNLLGTSWKNIAGTLREKTLLGEYTPITGVKKDYYPRIIDDATFAKLQHAIDGRKKMRGRRGASQTNLFSGLVFSAWDGTKMTIQKNGHKVYRSNTRRGPGIWLEVMERAVLSFISDAIKPEDLTAQQPDTDKTRYEAELAGLQHEATELIANGKGSKFVAAMLARLEGQINALEGLLETIRRQRSTTDEARLADAKDLIAMLANCPADQLQIKRQQLQSAIRGLVDSIWVLAHDGKNAEVQIFRKDYVACIWIKDGIASWVHPMLQEKYHQMQPYYDLRNYHHVNRHVLDQAAM